jgi:hypothetical protein
MQAFPNRHMRSSTVLAIALIAGGEAKALVIRYDVDDAAETASGYTGGTIEVGSLDQTLGTSPTTFTVEINNTPFTVVADFSAPLSGPDDISYFTFPENSWEAANFNFGEITSATQWSNLLGTFTGTEGEFGTFNCLVNIFSAIVEYEAV